MKLANLKIDSARLEHGDWVGDIPGLGDIRLRVRGLGNDDYRRRQSELSAALPRHLRKEPAEQDKILNTLIVETLLEGWEKVEADDGKPLAFTRENVLAILSDPDMRAFSDGVIWAAGAVSERRKSDLDDDAGN
ncbi:MULTISPECIES: hypothetical protein [Kaistia]|uniref:Phage tail assembly chaperone n=1 Tax=Kaistia nematophila TaxID=2994654 RepID=A0A9X3ILF5_9HYPH|nr:hypothetical protein [Kaistia nematophila]MCX5570619.1 hypothetical protein [Kaistia nematophila]